MTAVELGLIKEVGYLEWRLTVKGYKLAEKLWGPKEEACSKLKHRTPKRSIFDVLNEPSPELERKS